MHIVTFCENNHAHIPDIFDSLPEAWNCMARLILRELKNNQVLTKTDAKEKLIKIVNSDDIKIKEKILTNLPNITYDNFLDVDPEFTVTLPEYTFTVKLFTCYEDYKLIHKGDDNER